MESNMENHEHEWHALNSDEVLGHFKVKDDGLTSGEAKKRLAHYASLLLANVMGAAE